MNVDRAAHILSDCAGNARANKQKNPTLVGFSVEAPGIEDGASVEPNAIVH